MLAITRYRVADPDTFQPVARKALDVLATLPGHRTGHLARNTDEPDLWAMVTEWEGAGFYRRALGHFEVRTALHTIAPTALDEPGTYEIV